MVNFKSAVTFGLIASTATAASLQKDKRHVHHRRAKAPCTTSISATAPFAVGNSTVPAGTGAVSTSTALAASSSQAVVTYTVVPVPINPTTDARSGASNTAAVTSSNTAAAASSQIAGSGSAGSPNTSVAGVVPVPSGGSGSSSQAAGNGGSACGAATSYVTVQQTITVTAAQVPVTTSSSTTVVAVVSSASSTAAAQTTEQASAAALLQIPGHGHKHSTATSVASVANPTSTTVAPVVPSTVTSAATVVQPSTTSSAPTSSSSSAGSTGGATYTGAKPGVAFNPNQGYDFASLDLSNVAWLYDWGQKASVPAGTVYIPTLHDGDKAASFAETLASQTGITYVKHLNEGDMPVSSGGCALTPSAAAQVHKQYVAPLQGKYQIGFPAVSSNDSPSGAMGYASGIQWLEGFIAEAGCDFAFGDAHWYGVSGTAAEQATAFLTYVDTFISRLDKACPNTSLPVWFTEFAPVPVSDQALVASFLSIVTPELQKNARIDRFSPYVENNVGLASLLGDIATAIESLI